MRELRGVWNCTLCGTVLDVRAGAKPRMMIEGVGGRPNQRVIYVGVKEFHRCVIGRRLPNVGCAGAPGISGICS